VSLADSREISCDYEPYGHGTVNKIYVEADGELIGTLPAKIEIVPDALTILAPKKSSVR
jgi:diacylglycerol kinase family enzyme